MLLHSDVAGHSTLMFLGRSKYSVLAGDSYLRKSRDFYGYAEFSALFKIRWSVSTLKIV